MTSSMMRSGSTCGCGRWRANASAQPPIRNAIGYGIRSRFARTARTTTAPRKVRRTSASAIRLVERNTERADVERVPGDDKIDALGVLCQPLHHTPHRVAKEARRSGDRHDVPSNLFAHDDHAGGRRQHGVDELGSLFVELRLQNGIVDLEQVDA